MVISGGDCSSAAFTAVTNFSVATNEQWPFAVSVKQCICLDEHLWELRVKDTVFKLGTVDFLVSHEGEFTRIHGKPISIPKLDDPTKIESYIRLVEAIQDLKLASWQRLKATSDFVYPALSFPLRNAVFKNKINQLDLKIKKRTKETLYFRPKAGPTNYIYCERNSGCLGYLLLNNDIDIAAVDAAYKLLTSRDDVV